MQCGGAIPPCRQGGIGGIGGNVMRFHSAGKVG
jgi:hypothetical protein